MLSEFDDKMLHNFINQMASSQFHLISNLAWKGAPRNVG